jgi:hypothetical protein
MLSEWRICSLFYHKSWQVRRLNSGSLFNTKSIRVTSGLAPEAVEKTAFSSD